MWDNLYFDSGIAYIGDVVETPCVLYCKNIMEFSRFCILPEAWCKSVIWWEHGVCSTASYLLLHMQHSPYHLSPMP
jgi:hypothetical protein